MSVCGCVCFCINTHAIELTAASSKTIPVYNMDYISYRDNPFNLVHLSQNLMSDCTKKGHGGLGSGGWAEQTAGICAVFSLLFTVRLQGLFWRTVTVSLLAIKENPNF